MNELDKLNAERQAAHEHAQAERMQRATTVRPKPRRWRRLLVAVGLAVTLSVLGGCTAEYRWKNIKFPYRVCMLNFYGPNGELVHQQIADYSQRCN